MNDGEGDGSDFSNGGAGVQIHNSQGGCSWEEGGPPGSDAASPVVFEGGNLVSVRVEVPDVDRRE